MAWMTDQGAPVCYQAICGLTASMLEGVNAPMLECVDDIRPPIIPPGKSRELRIVMTESVNEMPRTLNSLSKTPSHVGTVEVKQKMES